MSSLSRMFKKKVKKSPAEENVELLGDEGEAVKTSVQSYEALAAYSKYVYQETSGSVPTLSG